MTTETMTEEMHEYYAIHVRGRGFMKDKKMFGNYPDYIFEEESGTIFKDRELVDCFVRDMEEMYHLCLEGKVIKVKIPTKYTEDNYYVSMKGADTDYD